MTLKKTCLWCPDPPERGKAMCRECLDKAKKYREDLKKDRLEKGECTRCGSKVKSEDLEKQHTTCADCRKKDADRKLKSRVGKSRKATPDAFSIPEI